jgi:hypothetical protein
MATPAMNTNIKVGTATTAKINMDAFAFEALSGKNLYKNLIRAIVRELSCNALDSHTMAGKSDMPIDIHLPTTNEPYFGVRDYGIGLDDEGVRETYLTYFGSTKREDVNQIGAWGLGSKTPIGYTENFTVTAIKDGIKRIYAVYKNESGLPTVDIMSEMPTDECNGLEVVMPVIDSYDMDKFRSEAQRVFTWFPVKPNFNVPLLVIEPDYKFKDVTSSVSVIDDSTKVVHGNIAYNVDRHQLDGLDKRLVDLLYYNNLLIHCESGTIDYSMSREELSYSTKTIETIKSKLLELEAALPAVIDKEFDGVTTKWDLYITAQRLMGVDLFCIMEDYIKSKSPLHVQQDEGDEDTYTIKSDFVIFAKSGKQKLYKGYNAAEYDFKPNNDLTIIVNDTGKTTGLKKLINFNFAGSRTLYVCNNPNIKDVFMDKYGDSPTLKMLSSLQKAPTIKKDSVKGIKARVLCFDDKFDHDGDDLEKIVDGEVFAYVEAERFGAKHFSIYQIRSMANLLGHKGKIYAVHKSALKLLKDTDHIYLKEEVVDVVEDYVTNFKVDGFVYDAKEATNGMLNIFAKYVNIPLLLANSVAVKSDVSKQYDMVKAVARGIGVDFSSVSAKYDEFFSAIQAEENMLSEKYPLVYRAFQRFYDVDKDTRTELEYYIKAKTTGGI